MQPQSTVSCLSKSHLEHRLLLWWCQSAVNCCCWHYHLSTHFIYRSWIHPAMNWSEYEALNVYCTSQIISNFVTRQLETRPGYAFAILTLLTLYNYNVKSVILERPQFVCPPQASGLLEIVIKFPTIKYAFEVSFYRVLFNGIATKFASCHMNPQGSKTITIPEQMAHFL